MMRSLARALAVPVFTAVVGSSLASFRPGLPGPAYEMMCMFLVLLCVVVVVIWAAVAVIRILIALFQMRWRIASFRTIVVTAALPLVIGISHTGDYIHLVINYPRYRAAIARTETRPIEFPWGDYAALVTDGYQFRALLYDDSGNPPPPEKGQEGLITRVRPFVGNFYIKSISSW